MALVHVKGIYLHPRRADASQCGVDRLDRIGVQQIVNMVAMTAFDAQSNK